MTNNLIALLDQTIPSVNALFDSPIREDASQTEVGGLTGYGPDRLTGLTESRKAVEIYELARNLTVKPPPPRTL